jgi:hypothetical protein
MKEDAETAKALPKSHLGATRSAGTRAISLCYTALQGVERCLKGKLPQNETLMRRTCLGVLAVALLPIACAQLETSQNTDLSIDTYSPPPDALAIAETRAKEYWAKHREQIGSDVMYLAIQSDTVFSDQIPDLYRKLEYSPGVSSSDLEDYGNNNHLEVYCVSIFDTRTGKLSPNGYAVVDLPRVGHLARFGIYTATYIGRGG